MYKGYPSAREALVVNGKFLLRQLAALDGNNGKGKGKAAASLSDGAFAKALATEVCAGRVTAMVHRMCRWRRRGQPGAMPRARL